MLIKWSLEPYLQNCMQNIESSCCLIVQEKHPVFYHIPKALCSSKTVQTPSTSHSRARAKLGASHAPSALTTPFLVSENCLWCSKVTKAQTFCLEMTHSPFKPQQTWQAWWSPFGIYLHPNNSDLPVTLYAYSLPKNLPSNRITFSVHAHLLPCKLLEIKNYVIYYHFYYLNPSTQSFTYSMGSINLLNYRKINIQTKHYKNCQLMTVSKKVLYDTKFKRNDLCVYWFKNLVFVDPRSTKNLTDSLQNSFK